MMVLQWRASEMALSEVIARSLRIPCYLFAIKHPLSTFVELLYPSKPLIYASHPITAARTLWNDGGEEARERASGIVRQASEFSAGLANDFTVIEPTAIDESCFKGDEIGRRWDLLGEESDLLWVAPEHELRDRFWNVPDGSEDGDASLKIGMLAMLQEQISYQINARDRKLVDQCHTLAAYRPTMEGSPSTGIGEELAHYDRLHRLERRTTPAYVHHPPHDEADFRRNLVLWVVEQMINDGKLSASDGTLDAMRDCMRDVDPLRWDVADPMGVADEIAEVLRKAGIQLGTPVRRTRPLSAQTVVSREENKAYLGKEVCEAIRTSPLREHEETGSVVIDETEKSPREYGKSVGPEFFAATIADQVDWETNRGEDQ